MRTASFHDRRRRWPALLAVALAAFVSGCGTTRWSDTARTATEQLLLSDAIDQAVNQIDFSALRDKAVYFDTKFLAGVVDEHYLVSSLRQHLLASGCLVREKPEDAEYIVEARAGAVGTDRSEFSLGSPSMPVPVPGLAGIPVATASLPAVTLARKSKQRAVAKLAVFAFNRETGKPVWQSGIAPVTSHARNTWVLGAGPIQKGTIYNGTLIDGEEIPLPRDPKANKPSRRTARVDLKQEMFFSDQPPLELAGPAAAGSDVPEANRSARVEPGVAPVGQPQRRATPWMQRAQDPSGWHEYFSAIGR